MPRNPAKTPCSVDDCRAWAIRGSDPPLCSPHRTRAARSEQSVADRSEPDVTDRSEPDVTDRSEQSVATCPWLDSPFDPEEPLPVPCDQCNSRWRPPLGTPKRILLEHAERELRGVGAPLGNENRRTHGFYARALAAQEQADFDSLAADATLDAEIAIARVALRRVLDLLSANVVPGPDPSPLTADEIARLTGLAIRGTGAVSRLLRARQALALAATRAEKDQPTCSVPYLMMLADL